MQTHLADHETAYPLKETQLLLNPLQPFFDIFCL